MDKQRQSMATSNALRKIAPVAGATAAAVGAGVIGLGSYVAWLLTRAPKHDVIDSYTITPWELDVPYEDVRFASFDGLQLAGWWMGHAAEQRSIVVSSGRGRSKSDLIGISSWMWRRGFNVLAFDYRGQGESDYAVQTIGLREADDFVAAVDYVANRLPAALIGAVGYSMGAAATIVGAAHDQRVRAVVADSPFADLKTTLGHNFSSVTRLPSHPFVDVAEALVQRRAGYRLGEFAPIREVAQIAPRPLLIIGGADDHTIRLSEMQRLYQAAGEPKELWIEQGVEHVGVYFADRRKYVQRVGEFFARYLI
jgi:dipeptidyl aminopeptidase/acylaminoacyl peptidase